MKDNQKVYGYVRASSKEQNEDRQLKSMLDFGIQFESLEELETELFDYVNWYNNIRIHSSLNYLTPIEYKKCPKKC